MSVLQPFYLWLLAAHIVFVVFWMAGLFIFPRYLVHHQDALAAGRSDEAAQWVEREGKLRRVILTPAMLVVIALGLLLATVGQHWGAGWLGAKLVFVLALAAYHGWAVGYAKRLARGEVKYTSRQLRLINELPAVALVAIVVLVVVKPF